MKTEADDVVIHRKGKSEEKSTSKNKKPKVEDFDKQFVRNIKIISILFMVISGLLFLALISYSSKDEAFLDIRFSDLFGLIKGSPEVIAKAEMTNNWLGLLGALISNYAYNFTFGYSILLSPIFLFFWARDLFKYQRITEKILKNTTLYLVLALLLSGFTGTMAKISWMPEISKEVSGVVGYYISSLFVSLIGTAGSSILLFVLILVTVYFGFGLKFDKIKELYDRISNNEKINLKKIFSFIAIPYKKLLNFTRKDSIVDDENKAIETETKSNKKIKDNRIDDTIKEDIPDKTAPKAVPVFDSARRTEIVINDKPQDNETARIIRRNAELATEDYRESLNIDTDEFSFNNSEADNNVVVGIRRPSKDITAEIYDEEQNQIDESPAKEFTISFESPKTELEETNDYTFEKPELDLQIENTNENIAQPEEETEIDEQYEKQLLEDIKNNTFTIDFPNEKPQVKAPEQSSKKLHVYLEEQPNNDSLKKLPKNPISTLSLDEKINYKFPTIELLKNVNDEHHINEEELKINAKILQEKLETFKIVIENLTITPGPVVTQYEFIPAAGIKISRIENLSDDIAMALKARGIRIIAPIPGKGTVGIEIPNQSPAMIHFSSIIKSSKFHNNSLKLPLALGKTINGEVYTADLAKMPHLLIAGATGSGKSVGINTVLASLLYKMHPRDLKFVIIDPKKVELRQYEVLANHFLALSPDIDETIITDPQDAVVVLKALCAEMDKRYDILASASQRNINDYNQKVREGKIKDTDEIAHREMPYIVVIIDELADLMLTASKEVETPIIRLAQLARAVGIHLVVATQRPSVDVITGIIKANFPARISYLVASKIDSRTILDVMGAEQLLGNGDMLFLAGGSPKPIRVQNAFISTDEVEALCEHIGNQKGYSQPYYLPSIIEKPDQAGEGFDVSDRDPLFEEAARLVIKHQTASVSLVQRRLKVGYARAGRIIDELEAAGIISSFDGSKSRNVYFESEADLEAVL